MNSLGSEQKFELCRLVRLFRRIDRAGLPRAALEFMWTAVLWNAVDSKYENIDRESVQDLVKDGAGILEKSLASGTADLLRQLSTLRRIETEWRYKSLDQNLFLDLHAQTLGIQVHEVKWREKTIVLEDDFITPVPSESIEKEMQRYWRLMEHASKLSMDEDLEIQLTMAVEMFSLPILIHPFPDGNGRTARLMVNLALRRWQLPYLPIPKVRNSPEWLASLQNYLLGRPNSVLQYFRKWMLEILQKLEGDIGGCIG